jgi:hypothetical protein
MMPAAVPILTLLKSLLQTASYLPLQRAQERGPLRCWVYEVKAWATRAHDDHPGFNFLFRLLQPRNDCSSFIEYLVHALQLTGLDCVFHGFISNEGEFRLTVSKILKQNHVVRTFYSFMFYS